jgi:hypothetical protein
MSKPNLSKSKALSLLLILAVWAASLCVMIAPAHACCPKANVKADVKLPACCVSHATAVPKALPQTGGADPGAWVTAPGALAVVPHWISLSHAETQSLLAHQHVPDQSNRHRELEVWLN